MSRRSLSSLLILLHLALIAPALAQTQGWTLQRDIEFVSRWPVGASGFGEDRITADLYRPDAEGARPAAVIISSSGGVAAHVEHYYARLLATNGMAALVVDSFSPRGVKRTGDDQNRVAQQKSNADAFAGLRWLQAQPFVDRSRVIVLGMSRGGEAAYSAAMTALRRRMDVGDLTFAAHVAIAPGSCNFPQRDARMNGKPVLFMLAEYDQVQLLSSCFDIIERMKKAGGAAIRVAVYPGVHHSFESTGGIGEVPQDWASTQCAGRFLRDENFILYERATGKRATTGSQTDFLFSTCLKRGYLVGGDGRVKAQASADLLQFLRDVDVLQDEAARAATPDCASLPEGVVRIVCARARAGWTADLVGLARAHLHGPAPRDPAVAARLFELAAARGHARAQWELALLLRQGIGVARDPPRALALAKASAEAGEAIGMNVYGVMIRDGIGRPADDIEARRWFEHADELMDSYASVNLARYLREGKAGFARAPEKAIALLRKAIARDENPWGLVVLADMLEQGEGAPRDPEAARGLYRAAAAQDREPAARERATQALARMGAAPR